MQYPNLVHELHPHLIPLDLAVILWWPNVLQAPRYPSPNLLAVLVVAIVPLEVERTVLWQVAEQLVPHGWTVSTVIRRNGRLMIL